MFFPDGNYTIYAIEFKNLSNYWASPNFDYFGTPTDAFSTSGKCWKKTGILGVFSEREARKGLKVIRAFHPDHQFRIVKYTITQSSKVLS